MKPSRRPSRKYRRRPSNLLQEYNRRSKKDVWLETHIWHAKRFHMKREWGYALPDTATCRGHRASLRAATTGCLLQVCYVLRVSVASSDYVLSFSLMWMLSEQEMGNLYLHGWEDLVGLSTLSSCTWWSLLSGQLVDLLSVLYSWGAVMWERFISCLFSVNRSEEDLHPCHISRLVNTWTH